MENLNDLKFLAHAIKELAENNVSINLLNAERVSDCNGYFDDSDYPILSVATGKPFNQWFPTFVHEFCHFCQWRDNGRKWPNEWLLKNNLDPTTELFYWYSNAKQMTKEEALNVCEVAYLCERDCEIRTKNVIIGDNLSISPTDYIRRANSYLVFYFLIPEFKSWYKTAPYESNDILEKMPSMNISTMEEHKEMAKNLKDLYEKFCFEQN